jgi:hypothetical protein
MRYVFASYVYSKDFNEPYAWLKRINAYAGILKALAKENEVISIEQINYEGLVFNENVGYHFMRFFDKNWRFFPKKLNNYIKAQQPQIVVIQGSAFSASSNSTTFAFGPAGKNNCSKPCRKTFFRV